MKKLKLLKSLGSPNGDAIKETLADVGIKLLKKNRKYGDSALDPKRVFSEADKDEQIRVRIDDKLSRIANGIDDEEDTIDDLIGYLILLKVHDNDDIH